MNVEKIESIICSAARLYRELNKPLLASRIDMTHDIYADEEAEEPMLSVDVKGEPKVKILDLIVKGSLVLILLSVLGRLIRAARR